MRKVTAMAKKINVQTMWTKDRSRIVFGKVVSTSAPYHSPPCACSPLCPDRTPSRASQILGEHGEEHQGTGFVELRVLPLAAGHGHTAWAAIQARATVHEGPALLHEGPQGLVRFGHQTQPAFWRI